MTVWVGAGSSSGGYILAYVNGLLRGASGNNSGSVNETMTFSVEPGETYLVAGMPLYGWREMK